MPYLKSKGYPLGTKRVMCLLRLMQLPCGNVHPLLMRTLFTRFPAAAASSIFLGTDGAVAEQLDELFVPQEPKQ